MSPKTAAEIGKLLGDEQEAMRRVFMRRDLLARKIRGRLTRTWMPKTADAEYKDLFRKASGPWLEFTRDAIAQGIRVDGCTDDDLWTVWQQNGMDGRQNGINRETVGIGLSYLLVVPAGVATEVQTVDENGVVVATEIQTLPSDEDVVMRPMSSLQTYAHFDDPWDEYPTWVLSRLGAVKPGQFWDSKWLFVDSDAVYRFDGPTSAPNPQTVTVFEHGLDYCPVSELKNTLPTEGAPESSVERGITTYERIVDATFTLEMVQRYGAFPQKYMSGGSVATGADGRPLVNVSADSLLHSTDPETKFGSFAAASLADAAAAKDSHIKDLAAVCQVPPHYLLGAVVNMSAEGIAAAESGYFRNINERRDSISEGYELALRIAADILGLDIADPSTIEVHFEDVSSRSLAQVGSFIAQVLPSRAPLETLFALIPGVSQREAQAMASEAAKGQQAIADQELAIAKAATPPVPKELNENVIDTTGAPTPPTLATPPPTAPAPPTV